MIRTVRLALVAATLVLAAPAWGAVETRASGSDSGALVLVVCAPGYPGNTLDAQSTMDGFAQAATEAAGWPDGRLHAVYHETLEEGVARLAGTDAALALVPLPLYLRYAAEMDLRPVLNVEKDSGDKEIWSLVARKGVIASPAALSDWELTGMPGYAPGFVRGPVLGNWGSLPGSVRITFSGRVLSALRRADAGEPVAVILDRAQAESLASLPFAAELEVVHRSQPLTAILLCTVGSRLPEADSEELSVGLLALHKSAEGREVLASMQMKRFRPLDRKALQRAEASYRSTPPAGH
jgi:hypothetical protein